MTWQPTDRAGVSRWVPENTLIRPDALLPYLHPEPIVLLRRLGLLGDRNIVNPDDIDNRFAFHPATTDEKRDGHTSIRRHCQDLATFLNDKLPEGREKSFAITKLEEVMFWGNAALARNNKETS